MARRSARLSKANRPQSPQSSAKSIKTAVLDSVTESDEFRDAPEHQPADDTMKESTTTTTLARSIQTPKTEPRPSRGEMHPKTVHATTAEPDSGFKLGFVDIDDYARRQSIGIQRTPSRVREPSAAKTTEAVPKTTADTKSPSFRFTFNSDSHLSEDAKRLMAQVRADAAKIKIELAAEREAQDRKDQDAEHMFGKTRASVEGRKIAQPRSKAGRFSDVHMAQFRKMDSIANHPSAFRAKPGYIKPTAQSLKRTGSRAELDAPERPRTAGKGTPGRPTPTVLGRATSVSPFKPVPCSGSTRTDARGETTSPAKRVRRSEFDDVSASRPVGTVSDLPQPPAALVKSKSSSTLFSPTKASLARNQKATSGSVTQTNKVSKLPLSNSTKTINPTPHASNRSRFSSASVSRFTSKLLEARKEAQARVASQTAQSAARSKPLPPLLTEASLTPTKVGGSSGATASQPASLKPATFASKLPTLTSLRSILRSPEKTSTSLVSSQPESAKKVDFTPSVKSRYAVKLAASSPSPAKMPRGKGDPAKRGPTVPYDPAAYVLPAADSDETWDEEEQQPSSPVDYPVLPPLDAPDYTDSSFIHKAKDHTRRESREFKSIFTTLHPSKSASPVTLTSVNTNINKTNPTAHANQGVRSPSNAGSTNPSPSTIRHVRDSEVTALIQPFENDRSTAAVMAHGLPAKKRRRPSESVEPPEAKKSDSAKRDSSRGDVFLPRMPGRWSDHAATILNEVEADADDEGARRGGKRVRTRNQPHDDDDRENKAPSQPEQVWLDKSPVKKKSVAREEAAKRARDRKSTAAGSRSKSLGGLTMSRLNALARPKNRG